MRKQVSRTDLMDWWLSKYHNTNSAEVVEKYPEECKSADWFKLYPVTQEQSDEWVRWAKDYIHKVTKLKKSIIEREWGMIFLDTSPYVKRDDI